MYLLNTKIIIVHKNKLIYIEIVYIFLTETPNTLYCLTLPYGSSDQLSLV